jgi:hypothetical protein
LRFDDDEDFARTTIFTATTNKEFKDSDGSDGDQKEPERDFDKLRAKVKLRAIKKYKEDELIKNKAEKQRIENEARGAERITTA